VSRTLPLTVLVWEGPQARAYLVRMRRAGLTPERILLMVRDPKSDGEARGHYSIRRAAKAQDRAHNFHPYAIRKSSPELVDAIAAAVSTVVDDAAGMYAQMYDNFSYDDFAPVANIRANSYRDPSVVAALRDSGAGTVLFTGGGIVPPAVFEVPGVSIVHVHTGFLPHVRGADVLLWSLLVRGRPGVSAFLMTPGLDDGDVLAAEELPPLPIALPPGAQYDDDTLYRALFSFIDPLIRAELLVADVLEPAADVADLRGTPQDVETGITYHFMHPIVRARALKELFIGTPLSAEAVSAQSEGPSPARYQKFYERSSATAPMRMAMDAARVSSPLRKRSLQNRQKDYAGLAGRPDLMKLHRDMNRQLALQAEQWDSYDYGEGYYYQSSDELGITGLRDTGGRVAAFGLRDLVQGRTVLEIGCNTGFLSLAIAPQAARIVAFELNPYLIEIAKLGAAFLQADNVEFDAVSFEDFRTDDTFDDVLSFANHHTYDGNTHQTLEEYFARCHALTKPGGRLVFESHPPEIEGSRFGETVKIIERYYDIERNEVFEYGTFLDQNRRFIVGTRRDD
jgi:SAM-dependent methyltransferase